MEYAILALSLISAALTVALFIALSKYRRALRIIERMPKFFQTLNRATDEQTESTRCVHCAAIWRSSPT